MMACRRPLLGKGRSAPSTHIMHAVACSAPTNLFRFMMLQIPAEFRPLVPKYFLQVAWIEYMVRASAQSEQARQSEHFGKQKYSVFGGNSRNSPKQFFSRSCEDCRGGVATQYGTRAEGCQATVRVACALSFRRAALDLEIPSRWRQSQTNKFQHRLAL